MALGLTLAGAASVQAAQLTPEERQICDSLRMCVDIIRRHDASQFDYDVLEAEFRRFGPAGRKALMDVVHSKAGNSDLAVMVLNIAPLTANEKAVLRKNWSLERAQTYLPFLMDGDVVSRDLLLLTLGSAAPEVREKARLTLLNIPQSVAALPLPQSLTAPLLSALDKDPIAAAAPYLLRLNSADHIEAFSNLLLSGDKALVTASYEALYRHNQAQAFQSLLSQMGRIKSPAQARAIGDMLLRRNAKRPDGFYLKFAQDISGDKTRGIPARAASLHAVLGAEISEMPEFSPARAAALQYLVTNRPFDAQETYLPKLRQMKAQAELNFIWDIAVKEKWVNRDRISQSFEGLNGHADIITDLLGADDYRAFSAGAAQANAGHTALLRAKLNHPVVSIRELAREKLKLPAATQAKPSCVISTFDSNDGAQQMPFFDAPWVKTSNQSRVILERKYLAAAHPTRRGWLAAYDLQKLGRKSAQAGAALVHFDNKTGAFEPIGEFSRPAAILPHRSLKLGETTNRFWIIDHWGPESNTGTNADSHDVSVYLVHLSDPVPNIQHMGAIPVSARGFTVAPNGDLLMRFGEKSQAPLRMSQQGVIGPACRSVQTVNGAPAPN